MSTLAIVGFAMLPGCFGEGDHRTKNKMVRRKVFALGYIESNYGYYSDSIHERECNGQIDARKLQGGQESLRTGRTAGMKLA